MLKKNEIIQTRKEEIINSITHAIGAFFSIIALLLLLYKSIQNASIPHIVSSSIYGFSLFFLYLMSTIYHLVKHPSIKKVFRRFDHIAIYLLIAGTAMPLALIALKGYVGWLIFYIETSLCFIGVSFKAIFGPKLEIISSIFYLLMGWILIFFIKPIYSSLSIQALFFIALGGVFYTFGIIFFMNDKKYHYFHSIWHVFVLFGSISHFVMVYNYIL
jgi:hemolysin III